MKKLDKLSKSVVRSRNSTPKLMALTDEDLQLALGSAESAELCATFDPATSKLTVHLAYPVDAA